MHVILGIEGLESGYVSEEQELVQYGVKVDDMKGRCMVVPRV